MVPHASNEYHCANTSICALRVRRAIRDGRICGAARIRRCVCVCMYEQWRLVTHALYCILELYSCAQRNATREQRLSLRDGQSAFDCIGIYAFGKLLRRTHAVVLSALFTISNSCKSVVCKLIENDIFDVWPILMGSINKRLNNEDTRYRGGWKTWTGKSNGCTIAAGVVRVRQITTCFYRSMFLTCATECNKAKRHQRNGSSSSYAKAVKMWRKKSQRRRTFWHTACIGASMRYGIVGLVPSIDWEYSRDIHQIVSLAKYL